MSENVFIFGAGVSKDANIPLLSTFVQTMWEIAIRGHVGDKQVSPQDLETFKNAIRVRDELDSYHGRSSFNDRNIEDLLSILTFNQFFGTKADRDRMNWLVKAIGRTIDLTCNVRYDSSLRTIQLEGPSVYRDFWAKYFSLPRLAKDLPTIITFNYDLVLERALLQTLNGTTFNNYRRPFPYEGLLLDYHLKDHGPFRRRLEYVSFGQFGSDGTRGTFLEQTPYVPSTSNYAAVNILKVHGSVNFPKLKASTYSLSDSIDDPLISPPIFTKNMGGKIEEIWAAAMAALRNAKNVVFVGYSLPKTDIYMQYFIKAALGPNRDLNRIFVFDPVLKNDTTDAEEFRKRYLNCFSDQFRERVTFVPGKVSDPKVKHVGSFEHFVQELESNVELLF